jgi:cell wall-associated NlpC family hydrolase
MAKEDFIKGVRNFCDTKYKMGGTDKDGIDCSRLIFE